MEHTNLLSIGIEEITGLGHHQFVLLPFIERIGSCCTSVETDDGIVFRCHYVAAVAVIVQSALDQHIFIAHEFHRNQLIAGNIGTRRLFRNVELEHIILHGYRDVLGRFNFRAGRVVGAEAVNGTAGIHLTAIQHKSKWHAGRMTEQIFFRSYCNESAVVGGNDIKRSKGFRIVKSTTRTFSQRIIPPRLKWCIKQTPLSIEAFECEEIRIVG